MPIPPALVALELERQCTGAGGVYSHRWWATDRCAFEQRDDHSACTRDDEEWDEERGRCLPLSQAACAALGGTWDDDFDPWLHVPAWVACTREPGPAPKEKCKAIGWHWMRRASSRAMECAAPSVEELECRRNRGRWYVPVHSFWKPDAYGNELAGQCSRPTRDKGRPCRDGTDCAGDCVVPSRTRIACDAIAIEEAGKLVTGVCSAWTERTSDLCESDGAFTAPDGRPFFLVLKGKILRCIDNRRSE